MENESASFQPDVKGEKSHKKERFDIEKSPPYQYDKRKKSDEKVRRNKRKYKEHRSIKRFEKKVVIDDLSSWDEYCACCNHNFGKAMHQCLECHRKYHYSCHIPIIFCRREKRKTPWWCSMCRDMNTIQRNLDKSGDLENISVGTVGRKIAERILMELYCYIDGSDIFRERPNKNVFPEYYKCIVRPVALNDVRDFMLSNKNYKLSEVVDDIKQVFVNALLFYKVGDPYFNLARRLLTYLHILYQSWIAPSTKNNQLTE